MNPVRSPLRLLLVLAAFIFSQIAGAQNLLLPPNAPKQMGSVWPSAMKAPLLAQPIFGPPSVLQSSQTYPNALGLGGIYQQGGSVTTASHPFSQSLGTNGRSCFTCHRPSDGMAITPGTLTPLFLATLGQDPVFAPVDGANCPKLVNTSSTKPSLIGALLGQGQWPNPASAYSLLLTRGLFRIFLPVPLATPDLSSVGGSASHPVEYSITVVSDPYGCNTDPTYSTQVDASTNVTRQMISVYRRPRMAANLKFMTTPALTLGANAALPNIDFITGDPVLDPTTHTPISGNIMWDGREPTLESQAIDATLGHAQATQAPTADQVSKIVAYENGVFAAQSYDYLALSLVSSLGSSANAGPAVMATQSPALGTFTAFNAWPTTASNITITASARASIARGQALFNTRQFVVNNVAGFNNATLAGVTNPFTTTCASCHGNMSAGNDPLPAGQRDIGIGGQAAAIGGMALDPALPVFQIQCKAPYTHPYYGTVIRTNDPGLALISGKCADVGRRSVPQIRGLASRGPYFSNGSVQTIAQIVAFYNKRFSIGLTPTEALDLANFLGAL